MKVQPSARSRLIEFYLGVATDTRGRILREIWEWDDGKLERIHDYIQWLFPLKRPSAFNFQAPRLTEEDIRSFRDDGALRDNLMHSFERLLRFYGFRLERTVNGMTAVVPSADFERRKRYWLNPNNHNHLRLTRVMTSAATLGLRDEALALQRSLLELARQYPAAVTDETVRYWRRAIPASDDNT